MRGMRRRVGNSVGNSVGNRQIAECISAVTADRNLSAGVSPPEDQSATEPQRPHSRPEPSRRWLVRLAHAASDLLALLASIGIVWLVIDDAGQIPPMLDRKSTRLNSSH